MAETIALMIASLRVGGFAFVEIPAEGLTLRTRIEPRFRAYRCLRLLGIRPDWLHRHGLSGISMLSASEAWTRSAFASAGAEVEAVIESDSSGNYRNLRYVARRAQ
jgi:hypothetical protein